MPGSVVLLLLSLLVLSTGSDARRIRKRGLNHKVGPPASPLTRGDVHTRMWLYFLSFSGKLRWARAHGVATQYGLC